MDVLEMNAESVRIYIAPKEHLAVLRPTGILAQALALNPSLAELPIDLQYENSILTIPASCAEEIVKLAPTHACDDRLRLMLAFFLARTKVPATAPTDAGKSPMSEIPSSPTP